MKTYRNCILLFLFCLFLYGTFSGLIPLLDPDEPVYGETAKEMLATGDWISPRRLYLGRQTSFRPFRRADALLPLPLLPPLLRRKGCASRRLHLCHIA